MICLGSVKPDSSLQLLSMYVETLWIDTLLLYLQAEIVAP